MQPISSFNSNLGTAILLVGGAGAGKTSLAMRLFPKTYVFVADLNFESGKRYLAKLNSLSNVVGFDTATPDEKGTTVAPAKRYDRMLACLDAATSDAAVEAIAIDSATFVEDIIKAKICNAQSEATIRLSGFDQWGQLVLTWKSIIMQLRQSGKKLIMTAHENKEKDESDMIFKYQIAVDGSIRGKLPALFSDVWRCEVVESNGKHSWMLRTLSNVRQEHLKNTYGLAGLLPQDEAVSLVRSTLSTPAQPLAGANPPAPKTQN